MASLKAGRPPEFTDDTRWMKHFNKKSTITLLISVTLAIGIFLLFKWIHLKIIGGFIGVILVAASIFVVTVPIPDGDILHGSGMTIDIVLFNILVRRKKSCIYVKNVDSNTEEVQL